MSIHLITLSSLHSQGPLLRSRYSHYYGQLLWRCRAFHFCTCKYDAGLHEYITVQGYLGQTSSSNIFWYALVSALQKRICYYINCISQQNCNCWHGFMGWC